MPNNLVLPSTGSKGSSRSSSKSMRSRQQQSSSGLSFSSALATLTLGKASRVFATFVSFHYLQDRVALPIYLFFVTFGAGLTLIALQRPWMGKRIGMKRARRVVMAGGLLALTLYVWSAGLRSAGPLRALLVDGAELPLLYVFAVVMRRELPERRKTRGALCMLAAYCLLVWDASGHVPDVGEIERSRLGRRAENVVGRLAHRGGVGWAGHDGGMEGRRGGNDNGGGGEGEMDNMAVEMGNEIRHDDADGVGGFGGPGPQQHRRRRRRLLTTFRPRVRGSGGVKDAFVEGTALRCEVGVMLVLVASVLVQAGRGFSRRLASELGGAKRHFALCMVAACGWMSPLALISWVSRASGSILSLQMIDRGGGGGGGGAVGGNGGGGKGEDEMMTMMMMMNRNSNRRNVGFGQAIGFIGVGFLWLVLPYYARAVVSTVLPTRVMMQAAVAVPFVMASGASVWLGAASSAGGVSWVLVAAFLLECVGVSLMMAAGVKRGLSELPIDSSGAGAGAGSGSGSGARPAARERDREERDAARGHLHGSALSDAAQANGVLTGGESDADAR